jgi:hypothetical protein
MGVTTDPSLLDSLHYWCEQCHPQDHKELLDGIAQGRKPWEERRRAYEQAELEAQKAKKGKKGKAKRASDQKTEAAQNGNANLAQPPLDAKKEKEKEKDKKEAVGRTGSTKRKAKEDVPEDPAKVRYLRYIILIMRTNKHEISRPKYARCQHPSQRMLLRNLSLHRLSVRHLLLRSLRLRRQLLYSPLPLRLLLLSLQLPLIYQLQLRSLTRLEQGLQSSCIRILFSP